MGDFVNRDKLRGLLAEQRLNQGDLAKLLGTNRVSVSNRLNGDTRFTENEISILAEKFGKSVFYLK